MQCRYCQIFVHLNDSTLFKHKNRVYVEKTCVHSRKKVVNESDACKKFQPALFFFCLENDQQYHINICISRQQKGSCDYCTQGTMVKEVAELAGLTTASKIIDRENQVHQPIIQKKTEQKIVARQQIVTREA